MELSKQLKQISKDTFFYGLGNALQRFIGFLLFPLYTRLLTQSDFGAQDVIMTTIMITSQFLILGLDSGAARYYYDAENAGERETILSTWLCFNLFISVPACIILIALANPLCVILFNDTALTSFFQLAIATLPFTLMSSVAMSALRFNFQSKKYSLISMATILIQALSSIYLIAVLELGLKGVFLAMMIAGVFQATLGFIFTYPQYHLVFSKVWLIRMLSFGVPMLPAGLSLWVLNYSNRYFLMRYGTLSEIGILSAAGRIASVLTFIISAFQIAWGPFAYSLIKDEEIAKRTYSKILTYFLLISITSTVGLTVFAREAIGLLATSAYEGAAQIVPLLCYGVIAWGAFYIVGMGYGIARKNYHTLILTILAAILNTGLNFLLIPRWGIFGAAASTMTGNLVALGYGYFAGRHYFPVQYETRKIAILTGIATSVIVAVIMIDLSQSVWKVELIVFKGLIFAVFLLGLFGLKVISGDETNRLWIYLVSRFARSRVNVI
jgi:O-antigen/teichoic acid export membrane protein